MILFYLIRELLCINKAETKNFRLPETLRPYRYELAIKPYFNTTHKPDRYDGRVKIYFRAEADTSVFTLHSLGLDIDNSSLVFESLTQEEDEFDPSYPLSWSYDNVTNFLTVNLEDELFQAGHNYSFLVAFNGSLKDNLVGLYRSSYVDSNGVTKYTPIFETTS